MNKLFFAFMLVFLAGCAETPIVRVRNCVLVGNGMYDCEEINGHSIGKGL